MSARPSAGDSVTPDLVAALRRAGVTDVDDSTLARALYSSDASLYRVVPQVVVRPRHRDELDAVLEVSRSTGVPITMRGAGTSIAGNAVGPGIVVDTLKHLNRVLSIDPESRTATVEPGVVHAVLQRAAAPHGLRFGPDPSTHTRCTIGGMIGNNACGSRALGYGRTSDNVVALDTIFPGRRRAGPACGVGRRAPGARADGVRPVLATGQRLLPRAPAAGAPLARPVPGRVRGHAGRGARGDGVARGEEPRLLVALGYPSMIDAADAVPALLAVDEQARLSAAGARLVACEGLDSRIVDLVRARGAVPELPPGPGFLLVELAGPEPESLVTQVLEAASALGPPGGDRRRRTRRGSGRSARRAPAWLPAA